MYVEKVTYVCDNCKKEVTEDKPDYGMEIAPNRWIMVSYHIIETGMRKDCHNLYCSLNCLYTGCTSQGLD